MRVKTDILIYGHNGKSLRVGLCPFISKIVIDSLLHPMTCLVRCSWFNNVARYRFPLVVSYALNLIRKWLVVLVLVVTLLHL